jgi:hypothetical protein
MSQRDDFMRALLTEMLEAKTPKEDQGFDPLREKREEIQVIQRQIVLSLQDRLRNLVEDGGSVHEIHELSMCICANLQIKEHIEDIF